MASIKLHYEDHTQNLSSLLQSMLSTSCFFDVTLAVDDKLFKAHQVILAMCSSYFEELFLANDCRNNHVTLCITNVKHEIMQALLAFMYEGEVNIHVEDLDLLVTTANDLKVKGLEKSSMNSVTVNMGNAPEIQANAEQADDDALSLMNPVEQNMSIKRGNATNVDIALTEIQYPTGVDGQDADNGEDGIEFQDFPVSDENADYMPDTQNKSDLYEDGQSKEHILTNKSKICHENVPTSSSSNRVDETVTVSFLRKNLHETCSSILVNDVCFSFVRNNKWKCTYRKHCQASIVLRDDKHIVFDGEHNHAVEKSFHQSAIASQETYTIRSLAQRRSNRHKVSQICKVKTSMNTALASGDSVWVSFIKFLRKDGWGGIFVNGLQYSFHRAQKLWSRWRCAKRNLNCKAFVFLTKDQRIMFGNQHTHGPSKSCEAIIDLKRTYTVVLQKKWCDVKNELRGRSWCDIKTELLHRSSKVRREKCEVKATPVKASFTDGEPGEFEQMVRADKNYGICFAVLVSVSFIKSPRKKACVGLIVNGWRYYKVSEFKLWSRWLCSVHNTYNCKAYVILTKDKHIVFSDHHNHKLLNKHSVVIDSECTYSVLLNKSWLNVKKELKRDVTCHLGSTSVSGNLKVDYSNVLGDGIVQASPENPGISFLQCDRINDKSIRTNHAKIMQSLEIDPTGAGDSSHFENSDADVKDMNDGSNSQQKCSNTVNTLFTNRTETVVNNVQMLSSLQCNEEKDVHNQVVQKETLPSEVNCEPSCTMRFVREKRARIFEVEQTPASLTDGESVQVSFIKSLRKKGCGGIIVNGREYRWRNDQSRKLWSTWKCALRNTYKCKACVILIRDQRIIFTNQHNHRQGKRKPSALIDSQRTYSVVLEERWRDVKKKLPRLLPKVRICGVEQPPTEAAFADS